MTQIFGEDGKVAAATVLAVQPLTISQVKTTVGKDGYNAVQVGAGLRSGKNISKAVKGHIKGLGEEGKGFSVIKEFRVDDTTTYNRGDKIGLESFAVGDVIEVSGISKGKGFQGVVKRHGFHGGPRSHGQKHSEREPGSIGGSGGRAGGRVREGMKMAGRMGSDKVTVKNLKVLVIDAENNQMFVSGAVPGRRGTLLEVRG